MLNFVDFVLDFTTWRINDDFLTDLFAHYGTGNRRANRNFSGFNISLIFANNLVLDGFFRIQVY